MYNFNELIERRGTSSLKWDTVKEGVIPLWVADMDFPVFPELQETLEKRAAHPFYGYRVSLDNKASFYDAIRLWYKTRHDLPVDSRAILSGPGTVLSLGMIVREFSAEGEGVLLLAPVYTPFFEVISENKRKVVEVFLEQDNHGRFILDISKIDDALDKAGIPVPLALFCSPHNPGGRVWTKEEIAAFLELTQRRNMVAAFDEIHGDLAYEKSGAGIFQHFVSAASLNEYSDRVIVVSGANKSFNLGGLHISHFVINDENLRATMQNALHRETHHEGDIFAEPAVETAYRLGAPWLDELRPYLYDNILAAVQFLNAEVRGIKAFIPDGTYLIWADVRGLIKQRGCGNVEELVFHLEEEAKVKITPGSIYGKAGEGYVRINAASPRELLMEGLKRIKDWAAGLPLMQTSPWPAAELLQ
ncbi:MAG: aminotransferase class I/II-fold pyridoxal phosphate-dependent enzyme [Treponema sp.]|nr:aminotransferase class I/II-fold pyridoxal phosphate-dependent enzyme [Treponema sp.]